jgi:hypothetical protein
MLTTRSGHIHTISARVKIVFYTIEPSETTSSPANRANDVLMADRGGQSSTRHLATTLLSRELDSLGQPQEKSNYGGFAEVENEGFG